MPPLVSAMRHPSHLDIVRTGRENCVVVRGKTLLMDELVDTAYFSPEASQRLRAQLEIAGPFPHLVLDSLFHPTLLNLVLEEFDMHQPGGWQDVQSSYERTRRSTIGAPVGPATQIYFDIVNSGWFTNWLSEVTGTPYLIPDPLRHGGGLHECRTGGSFAVHRDFDRHPHTGLKNEMVFITYLNRSWRPEWGSALELWDVKTGRCVTTVQPEFGRSLLLPHSRRSFHGHPTPLQAPDGRPRRSVAAYFYTGTPVPEQDLDHSISIFIEPRRIDSAKAMLRQWVPPILWRWAKKVARR